MAYESAQIEAALAAAVGNDPALVAELRLAFTDGVEQALAALAAARDAEAWRAAAWRLKGLAASFGATELMALAAQAASRAPGDEAMLVMLRDEAAGI